MLRFSSEITLAEIEYINLHIRICKKCHTGNWDNVPCAFCPTYDEVVEKEKERKANIQRIINEQLAQGKAKRMAEIKPIAIVDTSNFPLCQTCKERPVSRRNGYYCGDVCRVLSGKATVRPGGIVTYSITREQAQVIADREALRRKQKNESVLNHSGGDNN